MPQRQKLNIQISDPMASWWCGNSGCIPCNNLDRNGTCWASSIELSIPRSTINTMRRIRTRSQTSVVHLYLTRGNYHINKVSSFGMVVNEAKVHTHPVLKYKYTTTLLNVSRTGQVISCEGKGTYIKDINMGMHAAVAKVRQVLSQQPSSPFVHRKTTLKKEELRAPHDGL